MPTARKPQSILLFVAFIVFIDMVGIGLILLGSHHLVRVQECTHGDQP